jgi:hypothetical protein
LFLNVHKMHVVRNSSLVNKFEGRSRQSGNVTGLDRPWVGIEFRAITILPIQRHDKLGAAKLEPGRAAEVDPESIHAAVKFATDNRLPDRSVSKIDLRLTKR